MPCKAAPPLEHPARLAFKPPMASNPAGPAAQARSYQVIDGETGTLRNVVELGPWLQLTVGCAVLALAAAG